MHGAAEVYRARTSKAESVGSDAVDLSITGEVLQEKYGRRGIVGEVLQERHNKRGIIEEAL
jgi:hypothetical protein